MATKDDRPPTIKIQTEDYGEIPLDVFVALNPILKPWRDRGIYMKPKRAVRAVGDDKS